MLHELSIKITRCTALFPTVIDAAMLARIKSSLSVNKQEKSEKPEKPEKEKPEKPEKAPRRPSRQTRRLSKPPTNRSSVRLSNFTDDGRESETQTIASLNVEVAIDTDNVLRQATREALRYQLFDSEQDNLSQLHYRPSIGSLNQRWSAYNARNEPARTRPALNVDLSRTKSMPVPARSPVSALEDEEIDRTRHSSLLSTPILSSSPKMYAPIRRSSLVTPGLATRFSRTEFDGMEFDHQKRSSIVQKPGWEEVAADTDLDGFEWRLPQFVERSSTPSDLDVPHIGTIGFGALRITNGCPSPVLSTHSRSLSAHLERLESREGRPSSAAALASSMLRNELEVTITDEPAVTERSNDPVDFEEVRGRTQFPVAPTTPPPPPPTELDATIVLADEYISELPLSPFAQSEHSQGSQPPHLEVTSKVTELEDNLFEDEPLPEAASTTSSSLQVVPDTRPAASRTSTERSLGKSDSGYSSASSVYSAREARKAKFKNYLQTQHNRTRSTLPINETPKAELAEITRKENPPSPLLSPVSALSVIRVTDTAKVNESTQSFATFDSSTSMSTVQSSTARRLQKKRPGMHSRDSSSITVQGHGNTTQFDVPAVPAQMGKNLSERVLSLPELDRTYNNADKSDRDDDVQGHTYQPVEIRFPSPIDEKLEDGPKSGLKFKRSSSRPLLKRLSLSFMGHNKPSKSSNLPGECDHDTAFAIIQDSESIFDPHEARFRRVMPVTRPVPTQRHSFAGVSPFSDLSPIEDEEPARTMTMTGMDAQTAARLARTRSKNIVDREVDALRARYPGFNDRGGIPGRQLRPRSVAVDAPPMPPLPDYVGKHQVGRVSQETLAYATPRPTSTPAHGYHGTSFQSRMNANSSHLSMAADEVYTRPWSGSRTPRRLSKQLPPPRPRSTIGVRTSQYSEDSSYQAARPSLTGSRNSMFDMTSKRLASIPSVSTLKSNSYSGSDSHHSLKQEEATMTTRSKSHNRLPTPAERRKVKGFVGSPTGGYPSELKDMAPMPQWQRVH